MMALMRKGLPFSIFNLWVLIHVYRSYIFKTAPVKLLSSSLHSNSNFSLLSCEVTRCCRAPVRLFVLWLHIPKTGTSFANTLLQWGCPDPSIRVYVLPKKERPQRLELPFKHTISWEWLSLTSPGRTWLRQNCRDRLTMSRSHFNVTRHSVYSFNMHRAMKLSEAHFTAALFRLPRQRAFSNYLHLTYRYNETSLQNRTNISLIDFTRKPQYMSQQAKLLLGRHYRHRGTVSLDDAHRAADIVVNLLLYVGLTEEFFLSVRLFHAAFGGVPSPEQFENIRPSIMRNGLPLSKRPFFRYNEAEFGTWRDVADEIIYFAASYRFWRDVCRLRTEIESDGLGFVFSPFCYIPLYTEQGTCQ